MYTLFVTFNSIKPNILSLAYEIPRQHDEIKMLWKRWTEPLLWYHSSVLAQSGYSQLSTMCWENVFIVCTSQIKKCLVVMTCYQGGGETFPCKLAAERVSGSCTKSATSVDMWQWYNTNSVRKEILLNQFTKYWKLQPSSTSIDEEEKDDVIDFLLQFSSASQLLLSQHCSLSEESAELSWHQVQDPVCMSRSVWFLR